MKLPEIKRRDAQDRASERSKLSKKQQLARLDTRPGEAKRERKRLSS